MICDAHVHMGYYPRFGSKGLFYYSPRRILGVLNRCAVSEFIVSSTCAQVRGVGLNEILRESGEMKRLAGKRAHVFMWLSGRLYDEDHHLTWLDNGLIEGIKFHELETPWISRRRKDLDRVLSVVHERGLPVIFHGGYSHGCRAGELAQLADQYPGVRFDIAHCPDFDVMPKLLRDHPNVFADVACVYRSDMARIGGYDWRGRLLFGTDLPVWQMKEECSLTVRYRLCIERWSRAGLDMKGFYRFLGS